MASQDPLVGSECEELTTDYCQGGYHPVRIGHHFKDGRYVVRSKLGWGHYATVWLALDSHTDKHVALKIVKSKQSFTDSALEEISQLKTVLEANPNAPGWHHLVHLHDHFMHTGPNGTHVCMTFEVLGPTLLSLLYQQQIKHANGIWVNVVKRISKQVLLGLDYLHQDCHIVHADLKLENIMICVPDVEDYIRTCYLAKVASVIHDDMLIYPSLSIEIAATPDVLGASDFKIADLGNATHLDETTEHLIQTRQYRAPEVIAGLAWSEKADIWSLAILTFELVTGQFLFNPERGLDGREADEDHIKQMTELGLTVPLSLKTADPDWIRFFKRINTQRLYKLNDRLHDNSSLERSEANALAEFLLPLLSLDPTKRKAAHEALQSSYLLS